MATDDQSLILEARGLTDYDAGFFSDSEFDEVVGVAKEEIRADLGAPDLEFYTEETFHATRALFWFVCIGAKIRTGELEGVSFVIGDIEANPPSGTGHDFWFQMLSKRIGSAAQEASPGPALINMSRTNRTYGDNA